MVVDVNGDAATAARAIVHDRSPDDRRRRLAGRYVDESSAKAAMRSRPQVPRRDPLSGRRSPAAGAAPAPITRAEPQAE